MSRQSNNCIVPVSSLQSNQTNPPPSSVLSLAALSGAPCGPVVACLKDGFNFIPTQTFYATFFYVKKVKVTGVSAYRERITRSEGSLRRIKPTLTRYHIATLLRCVSDKYNSRQMLNV